MQWKVLIKIKTSKLQCDRIANYFLHKQLKTNTMYNTLAPSNGHRVKHSFKNCAIVNNLLLTKIAKNICHVLMLYNVLITRYWCCLAKVMKFSLCPHSDKINVYKEFVEQDTISSHVNWQIPGHRWWSPCAWCGRDVPGSHCWVAHPDV